MGLFGKKYNITGSGTIRKSLSGRTELYTNDGHFITLNLSFDNYINMDPGITALEEECFRWYSMSTIDLSPNISKIGRGVFKGCKNLSRIVIPDKVTSIERETFFNCI